MKNYLFLLVILSFLCFYSCDKEESELLVATHSYAIQGDSINLIGEIISVSEEEIIEYGFVMDGLVKPVYDNADSIYIIDRNVVVGKQYYSILNNIDEDITFLIRFFVRTEGSIKYGEQITLQGNGMIAPIITDFMPKSGYNGDIVKIFGKHFGSGKYINVNLSDKELEILERTNESLLVKIPDYIYREELAFKVSLNGHTVVSEELFLLQGPYVSDFTPYSGGGTTEIMIYGENFAETTYYNTVILGGQKAEVIEAAKNSLKISLYSHLVPAGHYNIYITSSGKSSVSEKTFQIVSPWSLDSQLPSEEGIAYPVVLSSEDKICLVTGTSNWISTGGYSQSVFEYDLSTSSWTQKLDFPGERRAYAAGFTLNGKGYVGIGKGHEAFSELSDFWEFDFQNDQWSQKNDFPGNGRVGTIAFTYNGVGYFLMGSKKTEFWKYNHNEDTWEQMPEFAGHERNGALHIIDDDNLYIIGGSDVNNPFDKDIWKFSFTSNQWSFVDLLHDIPMKIFKSDGMIYILERSTNQVFGINQTILYEFDIEQNQKVNQLEIFPGTDRSAGSFTSAINGLLYFGCGGTSGNGECLNDVWTYPLNNNDE